MEPNFTSPSASLPTLPPTMAPTATGLPTLPNPAQQAKQSITIPIASHARNQIFWAFVTLALLATLGVTSGIFLWNTQHAPKPAPANSQLSQPQTNPVTPLNLTKSNVNQTITTTKSSVSKAVDDLDNSQDYSNVDSSSELGF